MNQEDVYQRMMRHRKEMDTQGRINLDPEEVIVVNDEEVLSPEQTQKIREYESLTQGYFDW